MKRLVALLFVLIAMAATPAAAQNSTCPTAPIGTSNNQCASTAFVQNQIGVGITVGVTPIVGGTSGRIAYDNAGIFGELPVSGTGNVALVGSPAFTGSPTAPTQTTNDNTTKIATDAFVQQQIAAGFSCASLPSGVDCNTLNAQTSAYAPATSDCSKTITLGGAAFYALTVAPASGFPATCSFVVANIDSGRGKKIAISGVTFPNNNILWPLQTFTLKNEANAWTIINPPGRWKAQSAAAFNVDGAGANTNDGLGTGATGAFQTINGALGVVSSILDANGQGVTITPKCAGGPPVTYTENLTFSAITGAIVGNGLGGVSPTLIGDTTTPSNCILNGAQTLIGPYPHDWIIRGFQFQNSSGSCITADAQTWLRLGEMILASCNGTSGVQLNAEDNATIELMANYSITSSASADMFMTNYGHFNVGANITVTLVNTPVFPGGFVAGGRNATCICNGMTFSGAVGVASSPRYNTDTGGGIFTGSSGSATYFPGNAGGTATTPGWYN